MGNPKAIIDEHITIYDGLDPNDDSITSRRVQLTAFLQHINSYIHNYREWEWTYKESDITIAAGNLNANLPTDFMEFGSNGSLFVSSTGERLVEKSRYYVERLIWEHDVNNGINTRYFAISGGTITRTFLMTVNTLHTLYYRRTPETIAYNTTTMLIPDKYIETVIKPGLVFRSQQSKNDARDIWGGQFRDGLSQMCKVENPVKTSIRRMPLAIRGAW